MLKINLLPVKKTITRKLLVVCCFVSIVILALLCFFTVENYRLRGLLVKDVKSTSNANIGKQGINPFARSAQNQTFLEGSAVGQKEYELVQSECVKLDKQIVLLKSVGTQEVSLLGKLVGSMPENIWLTKIQSVGKGKISIQGESINYQQILHWVDKLKQLPGNSGVQLQHFESAEVIQFSLELVAEVKI